MIISKKRFNKAHREKMSLAAKIGYLDIIKNGHKLCPGCKTVLKLEKFSRSSKRTNGYQLWCKECGRKAKKISYHHYRKERVRELAKATQLKKNYGLELSEYYDMVKQQEYKCAICGRVPFKKNNQFDKKVLVVDHCHQTGKVRGLLCSECNFGLSKFEDNVVFLQNAIRYLKKSS